MEKVCKHHNCYNTVAPNRKECYKCRSRIIRKKTYRHSILLDKKIPLHRRKKRLSILKKSSSRNARAFFNLQTKWYFSTLQHKDNKKINPS